MVYSATDALRREAVGIKPTEAMKTPEVWEQELKKDAKIEFIDSADGK
jgi:hypothetical protein